MKTEKIIKVYETAIHKYNGQGETALRVRLSNGRRCWLVGYGGDLIPAGKADLPHLYNIAPASDEDNRWVGCVVHASRR